jgi:cytochrome c5
MKNSIIKLLFVLLVLVSCNKAVKTVTMDPKLAQGKSTYDYKCAKCHEAPKVGSYDAAGWDHQVGRMAARAGLTDSEKTLVLMYVKSVPKG